MVESKAIQRLQEKMTSIQAGTVRYEALESAKRFKSSWIELGRVLWTVWKEKSYRGWGYLTFEAYCGKELYIRPATAKKLLHSYYFLEKEEPTLLRSLAEGAASAAPLPSADSVNLLRLLKRRAEVPAEQYQKVRSYVLEKGREAPEVRQEVRTILQAARPEETEEARVGRRNAAVRRTVGLLKRLRRQLAEGDGIPRKLLAEMDSLVAKLEALG